MNQCAGCGARNALGNQFCSYCGDAFFQTQMGAQPAPKKGNSTLVIVLSILGLVILSCFGCAVIGLISDKLDPNKSANNSPPANKTAVNSAPKKDESKAIVNIPQLANKPVGDVDQILGKPKTVTSGKEKNKSYRNYTLQKMDDTMTVTFENNKAVQFDLLKSKENRATPQEYAELAGFEVKDVKPAETNSVKTEWRGNFGGVDFYSIMVLNNTLTARVLDDKTRAELDIIGEKPESSGYDGRVAPAVEYLKTALHDYDSSEFVKWFPVVKTTYKGKPCWGVKMQLRAKNAFGAYVNSTPFFYIQKGQVVGVEGLN